MKKLTVDIENGVPVARLVPQTAPVGESELEFWRRKAAERAKALHLTEQKLQTLELRILALLDEVES